MSRRSVRGVVPRPEDANGAFHRVVRSLGLIPGLPRPRSSVSRPTPPIGPGPSRATTVHRPRGGPSDRCCCSSTTTTASCRDLKSRCGSRPISACGTSGASLGRRGVQPGFCLSGGRFFFRDVAAGRGPDDRRVPERAVHRPGRGELLVHDRGPPGRSRRRWCQHDLGRAELPGYRLMPGPLNGLPRLYVRSDRPQPRRADPGASSCRAYR